MKIIPTALPDVVLIESAVFADDRGWFMESFNERRFRDGLQGLGLAAPRAFVQYNHSCSRRGVLRGLHFQCAPSEQGKLVRVVQGAAFDVAVDIRPASPTFGQWVGVELSAANKRQVWIPEGFAHGFLALEEDTHFLYQTTGFYTPACERAIAWDDADLAIDWPLLGQAPLVAPKDALAPAWSQVRASLARPTLPELVAIAA